MKTMKIGDVARLSGIGIETIRFYEREGLLEKPERRPSGYRQYDEAAVERLNYIRRAKELGFTLAEIRELMELSFTGHADCASIRHRVETKIADITGKIQSLEQIKISLNRLVEQCRQKQAAHPCPLIPTSTKHPAG